MKRCLKLFLLLLLLACMTACGNTQGMQNSNTEGSSDLKVTESQEQGAIAQATEQTEEQEAMAQATEQTEEQEAMEQTTEQTEKQGEEKYMKMHIQIGEHLLTATLVQNSSTEALLEMLSGGPVTINMSDYANMEKVGPLPESLPRNDEQITTKAGDLILYQGNQFVIYYDTNSWNFTRLGKMNDVTAKELKKALGKGDVTVELSLDSLD